MKILKTILIVIFALLFAVSGGLLVYSAINPPTELEKEDRSPCYLDIAYQLHIGIDHPSY